jgi:hypothetical protein
MPAASHVCGLPALHCFWLAAHVWHAPWLHGVVAHTVTAVQNPAGLQVCTVLPEHCPGAPGTHSPPHWFVVGSHTYVHAAGAPHAPVASHVSTSVVEPAVQRVVAGTHSPVHVPLPVHTLAHGVCG